MRNSIHNNSNLAANPEWTTRPERSNKRAMRLIVWIALTWGRRVARLLLIPISIYFVWFARQANAASKNYLRKCLARPPRWMDLFRHFHTFASTILDRVFLLKDQYGRFKVTVHGAEIVDRLAEQGNGCFLLGAHLGSFEIMRALGKDVRGLRISLVMYEENARKLNSVLAAINPNGFPEIIPLGRPESMLKVEEALRAGKFVGMLGDRTIKEDAVIPCAFLGEDANFPLGPFRLAAMLRQPIILMFGIYRGGNCYDVYFEELADMQAIERNQRSVAVSAALRRYVSRLEYYCRLAPYNWFNFYDFWK